MKRAPRGAAALQLETDKTAVTALEMGGAAPAARHPRAGRGGPACSANVSGFRLFRVISLSVIWTLDQRCSQRHHVSSCPSAALGAAARNADVLECAVARLPTARARFPAGNAAAATGDSSGSC